LDSYAALGREDERFTKKQINAKKQERTAGWREEQPREGVVRGWMIRRVNSEQKNREEANVKFRTGNSIHRVTD
jgi:hypothetical protein